MSAPHVMDRVDTYAMRVDVSYPGWDLGGPRPNVFRRNRVITSPDARPIRFMQPAPKFTILDPPREALVAEIDSLKAKLERAEKNSADMILTTVASILAGLGIVVFVLGLVEVLL